MIWSRFLSAQVINGSHVLVAALLCKRVNLALPLVVLVNGNAPVKDAEGRQRVGRHSLPGIVGKALVATEPKSVYSTLKNSRNIVVEVGLHGDRMNNAEAVVHKRLTMVGRDGATEMESTFSGLIGDLIPGGDG